MDLLHPYQLLNSILRRNQPSFIDPFLCAWMVRLFPTLELLMRLLFMMVRISYLWNKLASFRSQSEVEVIAIDVIFRNL